MALLFFKSHPVTQAMSTAAKPEELDFGQVRRNPGEPSPEQAASGKYNKPRIEWRGLTIAVENPAGSVRRGMNRHGISWEMRMKYDYGEVVGSCGVDGDPVDIYMGPNPDAPMVYVVHQRRVNDWHAYDEDKAMAGFDSEEDAKQAFLSCYTDPRFLGPITAMPVEEFVAKVRATKEKPVMIKSLLVFSKAHVGPYLRGGKMVNLAGYSGRNAQARAAAGQLDMFAKPSKPLGPNPYKGKDPVADTIDMFGHGEAAYPDQANPHDLLRDALRAKDLAAAISILQPLSRDEAHEALLRAGFSIGYAKTKQALMDDVQSQLLRAARDGKDGFAMREPTHTEPTADLVQEHKRLVAVLRSPSHEDDKVEAKKQAEELAELKGEHDHLLADIPGAKWARGKG